jgi:hypothetical protein
MIHARSLTLAVVAAAISATAASAQEPTQGVADLAWLAGCWEGTLSSGATYEEMLTSPRDGLILGMSRMTRDGRVLSWEFVRIAEHDGVLTYFAQPGGRPATAFPLSEARAHAVVFQNAGHDFPQRIRYTLDAPDRLTARIEGERDGQTRGMDFPLQRVPCPGP